MKGSSASYSKKKKWLIGAMTPAIAVCLAAGLLFMSATDGLEPIAYAASEFNNIVNANIGMHPKWIEETCISAKDGGVGDTYTNKHKVWHADVTRAKYDASDPDAIVDGVGNDVVMEKSPAYVFTGSETKATELAAEYSLKAGNEVVFNITDGDSAAKVWADAVAFAQSLGTPTLLADPTLAGTVVNGEKTTASCNGTGDENHNGFRVGTNTGNRNEYQGNFFINNDDGALGQYIIVRLQDDWTAKSITTTAPTNVSGQTVTNKNTYGANDYLSGVTGASSSITTTSFNYVTNDGNNTPNVFGEGTYLPTETSADGFTRIDSNDDGYVISWDLASNSCDYDGTQEDGSHNVYGYIYNDNCAFSYGRINVPTGVYIVLDLNGHKIDRALAGGGNYYGSVFHIDSKARLEIMDSTAYENASSARIEGTNAAGQDASGVAHTTNHGGTITGGNVEKSKKLNLPVTLQANLQSSGGGFNLSMWADLVVHSGTISNNKNSESGGAFYQRSKAAVTIFDGYVLDNESGSGGVTNLGSGSGCPFTMYGGVLAYNKSSGNGGAVNLARSSYGNFHGGEIMYNEAKKSGGGIALDGNSLGILDSVTISNNLATTSGGGVYVPAEVGAVDAVWRTQNSVTDHAFKFRGSLQVRDNKHGSSLKDGTADNVYLQHGTVDTGYLPGVIGETLGRQYTGYPKIGIGGPLIANGIVANVGVTLGDYGDPIFTSGYGANGNNAVDTFLYFFSDNNSYSVTNTGTSREATMGRHDAGEGGLTWLIEGTGVDADTDMESDDGGESTIKIVVNSSGSPTFYYKNPSNTHGFNTSLKLVEVGSKMNKAVKKSDGETSTDNLLEILQDRFKVSSVSLDFEYSMLKVTKISAYTGSPSFTPSGNDLTTTSSPIRTWESKQETGGDKPTYTVSNNFDNVNFHFKMGETDLTATANSVSEDMQKAISATDGSISYAGEYSVLVSGARYDNPSFKIKINQVGVRVDRALYYNGQKIGKGETLDWTKPWIDWNGDDNKDEGNDPTKANEIDQPYFIYSGDYYYPILSADYNAFSVFRLYNPYATEGDGYSSVAKSAFTGYVLDFTYANEYFGTNQPVRFGSHSGGGIEYQTMHRQPNSISGTGTYVPGVKNAGMYEVQFISSRSAASADENDADHKATGVYFAANNFAFSSKVNIYVDPASAEVELTTEAKAGFTYDAGEIKDAEIVIYDNTSNTHVNPHLDAAAVLEYFLFDDLKFKPGVYDVRTKLYYTLDQVKSQEAWDKVRPYGTGKSEEEAEKDGRPYIPSYTDEELQKPPEVVWDSKTGDKFDPASADNGFTEGILEGDGLKAFQALYEKTVDLTSNGKLVYIVDKSSFEKATKLEGNPTDARRYAVFVTLDLDVGYDDYNYNFDQNADHLVGLGEGTSYFWAFEFTVNPAEVRPYDFDAAEKPNPIPGPEDNNTSVGVQREVVFNGLGQFQLPTLNFTDPLGVPRALTGSAAPFKEGGTTFGEGLYYGSALTVQEGYDFIVKYYIEEYGLTEAGKYLDYVNVMNGQKLKVRIYIPAYKDATGTKTGANGNYVFDGKALGDARKDDEGYYYEIEYVITPVTVTTSLTITYTYDGTSREETYNPQLYKDDATKYPEQGGTVGMGVGGVWTDKEHGGRPANKEEERQQGFIYPFSVWRDNKVEAGEGTAVGPKVGKDKLKYTISNPQWLFSDTTYQSNENIKFGGGVYTFNTGSPNVGQYALSTVTKLGGGDLKTHHNYDQLEIDKGVVWVFSFSNSNDNDFKFSRQGFNGTADENGNYGNFVVGDTSTVTVIIEAKNIADENVFATKIQQAKDGSALPDSATQGGALAIYGDGYADIAYTTEENGAVVQDTAATKDGKYKMATFPFAGPTTYYRPHVKLGYYKYGVNGATSTETRGDTVTTIEEGPDFTLGWADNSMASVTSENAVGLSGTSAGQFASVIVNAQGNYTGSVTVNFYIRPAVIAIAHNGGAYDFKKGDEGAQYNGYYYDRGAHGLQLTFTNTEDYRPYTGMLFNARGTELGAKQVEAINTNNNIDISNVAYAYASQELFDAFHKKYFDDEKVDDKELGDLNKLYSVDPPIDADVYYAAIALSNENFVFKEAKDGEEFPSITGSNFGNGTNDLVRGVFEIKPATVTATIDAAAAFYNRSAHTASFSFTNERDGNVTPSTVLNEYEVTYLLGGQTEMIDAGTYTVTVTFGTHDWLGEGNIDDGMKSGVTIPTTKHSNFVFNATADKTRTFDFTIKPAEIKLGKFADVAYNKVGQGVPLDFTNTERNNDAVPTLADAAEGDTVTANEYTVTYAADPASPNAKLDGSEVPLNAGDYNVTVALTDAAKSKADPSLYNFKFVATAGVEQTIDADGKTVSSSYTITPATVNASVKETSITYNGKEYEEAHKQPVDFTNALGEDSIIPELLGEDAESDGVEYSVEYEYSGFSTKPNGGFIDRGSYTVTVRLKTNGNYTFGKRGTDYTYEFKLSYAILPLDITGNEKVTLETLTEGSEYVYTGESLTPTIDFILHSAYVFNEAGTPDYQLIEGVDYTVMSTRDVEVYYAEFGGERTKVTVTINGQNNFSGTKTFTFTILPAKVSVTANEGTAPEGTITVPYNKFAQALAFTFDNLEDRGTVVPVFSQNDGATNYKVTYKNQDGTDTEEYTQTNAPINAGTYTVTVTLTGLYAGGNFTFEDGSLTKTFTLVITPAELTLTISESFANDGAFVSSFVYDGQDYYSRLNNFSLDNVNYTVPNGSAVTEAFYLGTYSEGVLQANFKNAGTYYILFTFTGVDQNYTVTKIYAGSSDVELENITNYTVQKDGSIVIPFTITPAQITVNELSSKTYTGENIEADILFTNKVSGGVVPNNSNATYEAASANAKLADGSNLPLNAGTYNVTVTLEGEDATNFTIVDGTEKRTFTVDPAIISASVEKQNFTYDGTAHQQEVKFENALGEGAVTPSKPGDLETDGNEYSVEYVYSGFAGEGYNEFINRGSYTVTVDLKEDGNFAFGKSTSGYNYQAAFSYSILPKSIEDADVTITGITEGEHKTYTGASLTPTDIELLATTILGGYPLVVNQDYSVTHDRDVEVYYDDAAEQTEVTVTINGQNNFGGTLTYHFTIDPAKVSVTAADEDAGTVKVPYNKFAQALTFIFDNMEEGGTILPTLSQTAGFPFYTVTYKNTDGTDTEEYTQTNAPRNAGTYTVTVTLGKDEKGDFTFEGGTYTKTFTLEITPAELTLLIAESFEEGGAFVNEFVYDGKDYYNRLNGYSLNNENKTVPVSDDVSETFYLGEYDGGTMQSSGFKDAADYYILFTFSTENNIDKNYRVTEIRAGGALLSAEDGDYTVQENGSILILFTITPAEVSLNTLASKTYSGGHLTADILFINNSEGSDAVPASYDVNYTGGTAEDVYVVDAGTYNVTVALEGDDANNFTIADGTDKRTFTVDPAIISASVEAQRFTYDGEKHQQTVKFANALGEGAVTPTKLGDEYTLTYSYDGFSEREKGEFTDRGSYGIAVDLNESGNFAFGKDDDGAYNYHFDISYSILPKEITEDNVTGIADGESKTYTSESLTPTDIVIKTTLKEGSGEYTLIDETDYTLSHSADVEAFTRGAQTVVKVTITCQNNFSGTLTYEFTIDPAVASVTAAGEDAGTVKVTYNRYAQPLDLTFTNTDDMYADVVPMLNRNGGASFYTVTYKNQDSSDETAYTQTNAPKDAGTYLVTITLGKEGQGNFTFDGGVYTKTYTLIIEKAKLTLTISELFANGGSYINHFVYDGKDYYNRLNNFDLDNDYGTVPVGSEIIKEFYLGIYPADGDALTKFSDAGKYYILFAFKKGADKDVSKNYEVAAVWAGSSAVELKGDNYTVQDGGSIVIPFEITRAQITVNALSNKTYTGMNIEADILFTNVSDGSDVVPGGDYTVKYAAADLGDLGDHVVDAGKYTVTVTLTDPVEKNFEIVAWDDAGTMTREFTVDPAKLSVVLDKSVVDYSGSNYIVQTNFTNTSETAIVPTKIGEDYSLALVATDDPGLTPEYNAVIDAKTYNVTVTLLNDNFVFTDDGMTTTLTYTINPGTIELSDLGTKMTNSWETASYNPSNLIRTKFVAGDFSLVGNRSTDIAGMNITLISCTTDDGSYTMGDGYYEIEKRGTYKVTIQVSAPNHTTRTFTFDINVRGGNVLINVPEDFSNFLTKQYGMEYGDVGLQEAFLDLIKGGSLTVDNIPNPEIKEKSGQAVVDWLLDFGFTVKVDGSTFSTSNHLKVGDYALRVSLPDVDGGIRFHEESNDSQVVTSNTRFYHITPAVIEIDWGALSELKYSGRDQSDSIKGGVKIANLLAGDVAGFEIGHILIGTKADAFAEADEVVDAVQAGTEDLIRYYLRLRVDDATLTGDDKANYVFAEDGKVEEKFFEKDFNIARLELNILLSNSSSYYGNDYTENFAFTYMDANGSASVDVDEALLRKAVLEVLKLYLADVEVEAEFPGVNTYKVKATTLSSDFGNFKLEFGTAEATHEINRRPVALQMASSESIYGEATVLPDKNHSWTTSAGSLSVLEGDLEQIRDAIAISTNATTESPVNGIYTTSGTVIPNAVSGNYTITCADGVYTIRPRPIVIDIANRNSVYGEPLDDNLTAADAWKVATALNREEDAGDLNYGLRPSESNAMLGLVLSLNLTFTDSLACNRDEEGNIIAWPSAISGTISNENYIVTAWINGNYMVNPRKVTIEVGDRNAVYGDELARVGSVITLAAPVMNGNNTAVVTEGDWTYASTLGTATYAILPVDIGYLAFYVGKADTKSETAYAYVGKYPLVGAWAFGLESSSVSYCYDITFSGAWNATLNEGTAFEGAQDGAAGVYEIKPASITEEGSWNVNKLFYETSDPNKTEENGWFKMYLEQMLFSLKGDFNAPLADITPSSFTYSEDGSEAGKTTAFTALLPVNGKDETLTITFAKPQYRGIGTPPSEEPYYNEEDHLWYVHTGGRWSSAVTVSVANHTDATFTLTYIISNVIATVSLNSALGALEAVYGDYKYPTLAADLENYDENDIKDLPLSQALNEYIFENSSMIITVTGFETAFPESTLEDHVREIVNNCWVEVADAQISSGGYLMAGTYTLRLVAREGSGFFANFKASSASLPKGQVDQGAGNRLVIRPREIGIDWVDPAAAKRDEIIREDSDKITYTYSGYEYSQQPTFTNILPGDLVSDPAYQFLTETGAVVDTAKNVRKDGYYTIQVLQSALKGADSVNYRLPDDMTIRLDIIPREIYITIDDLASTVYGVEPDLGRVFTADDWHVTTGKGLGLAAGETTADLGIELHLELPSKDAALYVNAVKGEGNNDNYEFRFEGGNYEITPKSIHINIEDKESFYGDEFVALGFTVDGALAYDDTADDLLVALAKASGLDVGDYAITGVSGNPNYVVTFTDGTYTILRATNVWMREFEAFEFFEGENPPEDQKPLARFGEVHLYYFYDEACTEIVLDDISELDDGVYYVRAVVAGTDNYTALDNMYTFTILPTFSAFGNNMDIGLYVTIWSIQVVALLGAVLFVRRRKQKNGTKKS